MEENKFSQFIDRFLFGDTNRKLPYILLSIFIAAGIFATTYICLNADNLYRIEEKNLLVNKNQDPTSSSTESSTGQTSSNSTKKKSSSSSGSANGLSSSQSSGSSSGSTSSNLSPAYVAFYADNQSDTDEEDAVHLKVINQILATGANPIFHAGDLMEDGTQASLDRFNNIAGSMLSQRTFYGALGNNDRNGGDVSTPSPLYLANFSFPGNERWYSVNVGNLHIIILDSAFASGSASQLSWLASDLASSDSQNRITGVVFHHPTFAGTIASSLINQGADFVVEGHIHSYSKSESNGIYNFTLPGGASLGFCTARTTSSQIRFNCYNSDGGLIDSTLFNAR